MIASAMSETCIPVLTPLEIYPPRFAPALAVVLKHLDSLHKKLPSVYMAFTQKM
jgi:hypothetical protein